MYAPVWDRVVAGTLYFDIQPADLWRLDYFEGDPYQHQTARGPVKVLAYGFRSRHRGLRLEAEWDPAWFEREGMSGFIARYRGDL